MTFPPAQPAPPQTVLVVGGTGILAPAAAALAAAGARVTVVSRRGDGAPDGTESIRVDATSAGALVSATAGRRWDLALVYSPAVGDASLDVLRAVTARLVEVRVSRAADPADGHYVDRPDVLQLGWRHDEDGEATWHTPDEVSAATLEVAADGRGRVLGRVRPWEERP